MWKFFLSNKIGIPVEINNDSGEDTGLVVATRPHKTYYPFTKFFTNTTYGREMAQDASFGAGELLIHNGTDDTAWTMSNEVGGKWQAASTERPYAGTKSLRCDNPAINDVMQLYENTGPGTDISMSGNYIALTFWINVDKDWAVGDSFSIYGYIDTTTQVGNKVYLEDYFDFDNYDVYQFINIPLTDMGLEAATIDAFRIENEARAGGKSPKFYVDDMYLQTTGSPIIYSLEPDKGTWLHVQAFQITFVDEYVGELADGTMPNLSYDKILGITPTKGYIYRRYSKGNTAPAFESRVVNLFDLLSFPYARITNAMADATNTFISITEDNVQLTLKSEDLDKITFTLEDKFDDLLFFRISLTGVMEYR